MFAPKVTKAQTKTPDSPARKLASQPSTFVARPFGGGAVEQEWMLQRTIGNQATLRYLTQRLSNLPAKEPAERHEQDTASENMIAREAPRGPAWDFSKIPLFPPDRADQSQPSLAATPLPGAIQAKLQVGSVDDPLEHEADRVADQVMRMSDPRLAVDAAPPRQGVVGADQSEAVHEAGAEGGGLSAVQRALADRSPGRPLDVELRRELADELGSDFDAVRVHSDVAADRLAAGVAADAFTRGNDLYFAAGKYEPGTQTGRRLLRHELGHVAQQARGEVSDYAGRVVPPGHASEAAAVSGVALRGTRLAPGRPGATIQRQPRTDLGRTRTIPTTGEIEERAKPLAKQMSDAVQEWKSQAFWGVQNFISLTNSIAEIDELRRSGFTNAAFLQSLAGNILWAAVCFVPVPGAQFALSLAGIAIAAAATPRTGSSPGDKGVVTGVAEATQGYLDEIAKALKDGMDERARSLVLFHLELSQLEQLELFMTASFAKPMLAPGPTGKLTELAPGPIRKAQKDALTTRLEHFTEAVSTVGKHTELGFRLSLVHVSGVGGSGPNDVLWGIGYEILPRKTALDGKIISLGKVAIAKWIPSDVVDDVLNASPTHQIINAFATEVDEGPEDFARTEAKLRDEGLGPD